MRLLIVAVTCLAFAGCTSTAQRAAHFVAKRYVTDVHERLHSKDAAPILRVDCRCECPGTVDRIELEPGSVGGTKVVDPEAEALRSISVAPDETIPLLRPCDEDPEEMCIYGAPGGVRVFVDEP